MRKTVFKNVPPMAAKPAYKKELEAIYCDIDDKLIGYKGIARFYRCYVCKRELCYNHTTWDPDEPGDYPETYCEYCAEEWVEVRREMNERHWKEEEALMRLVKKNSLKKGAVAP